MFLPVEEGVVEGLLGGEVVRIMFRKRGVFFLQCWFLDLVVFFFFLSFFFL